MGQYVKVIQKNKGAFKNYLKKLESVQDFYITCGIHDGPGRRLAKTSTDKKVSRKKRVNIATLSDILEKHITWTQRFTKVFPDPNGNPDNNIIIPAGKKLTKPARVFIQLDRVPNVWSEISKGIQFETMRYLMEIQNSRGKRSAQNYFQTLAKHISDRQKQRITNHETEENSPTTMKIKGFDYALYQHGMLLNSIEGRVIRSKTGKKVRCSKVATELEDMLNKLNK